jgi:hypothetical protein
MWKLSLHEYMSGLGKPTIKIKKTPRFSENTPK